MSSQRDRNSHRAVKPRSSSSVKAALMSESTSKTAATNCPVLSKMGTTISDCVLQTNQHLLQHSSLAGNFPTYQIYNCSGKFDGAFYSAAKRHCEIQVTF